MRNLLLVLFLNFGMFAFGQNVVSSFSSNKKVIKTVREYSSKNPNQLTKNTNSRKSTYAYLTKITNSFTKEEFNNRQIKTSYTAN